MGSRWDRVEVVTASLQETHGWQEISRLYYDADRVEGQPDSVTWKRGIFEVHYHRHADEGGLVSLRPYFANDDVNGALRDAMGRTRKFVTFSAARAALLKAHELVSDDLPELATRE